MHQVFGKQEDAVYTHREGAYLIAVEGDRIAVIQTPKGYFFLGGGIDPGETHDACIRRDCEEEIGYTVSVGECLCSAEAYTYHERIGYFHPIQTYYVGRLEHKIKDPIETDHVLVWLTQDQLRGKLYAEMQNWALEQYLSTPGCKLIKASGG